MLQTKTLAGNVFSRIRTSRETDYLFFRRISFRRKDIALIVSLMIN